MKFSRRFDKGRSVRSERIEKELAHEINIVNLRRRHAAVLGERLGFGYLRPGSLSPADSGRKHFSLINDGELQGAFVAHPVTGAIIFREVDAASVEPAMAAIAVHHEEAGHARAAAVAFDCVFRDHNLFVFVNVDSPGKDQWALPVAAEVGTDGRADHPQDTEGGGHVRWLERDAAAAVGHPGAPPQQVRRKPAAEDVEEEVGGREVRIEPNA